MVQTEKTGVGPSPKRSTRTLARARQKGETLLYADALPEDVAKKLFMKARRPAGVEVAFVATTPEAKKKLRDLVHAKMRGRTGSVASDHKTREMVEKKIDTSAYDLSSRARALLQGSRLAADDLREAGGAFDLQQVQTLLNGVSRQAIEKRVKEGSLLALPGPSNRRRYPTVQFTRDGLVPGLKEVTEALPTRNPWAVLNFFVRPDDRLDGRKPIDVLRDGDIERVVSAARGMGVQGG